MLKKALCLLVSFVIYFSCASAEQNLDEILSGVNIANDHLDNPVLLVTVNGREIYDNDYGYLSCLTYNQQSLANAGVETGSEDYLKYIDYYKRDAMSEAIMHAFTEEAIKKINSDGELITIDEKDREEHRNAAKEYWDSLVNLYISSNESFKSSDMEDENVRAEAIASIESEYSISEDIFIDSFMNDYDYYAPTTALTEYWNKGRSFSEDEIEAFYNSLVSEDQMAYGQDTEAFEQALYQNMVVYYIPEGYRSIKQIVISVDDYILSNYASLIEEYNINHSAPRTVDERAKRDKDVLEYAKSVVLNTAKEKLDDIKAKLEAGVSFDDLIIEYNEDPGMMDEKTRNTGYLVSKKSVIYDKDFIDAAMSLKNIGDYSEPIIGSYGIFIVYYNKDIPSGPVEFNEDVKESVKEELMLNEKAQNFKDEFNKWQAASDIHYTEAGQEILDNAAKAEEYFSGNPQNP